MPYFGSSWDENWYGDKNKIERLNEYFMYGILVPYDKFKNWNLDAIDDISCIFNGRDGKFLIIGKILEKTNDDNPIIIPELEEVDKIIIQNSVKEQFGLEGESHYYFVTQY